MTEKYESRQQQIRKPADMIYTVLSDFTNLTPVIGDRVEDWNASADECSFKVKGFTVRLRMTAREPFNLVKIESEDAPGDFTFWLQLKEVEPFDTRMRLVLHADMNMVMKMMVGKKLQGGLDQMAEHIAASFNAV